MITIVHGGQTGVDRGAHEAAISNGWQIDGYMPSNARDELGPIPQAVAQYLVRRDKEGYPARTEANVQSAGAALIVVRDVKDPRETPGTAMTIHLVIRRQVPHKIVDPTIDATQIAHWIWNMQRSPMLPLDGLDPVSTRLLIAGPRESKWRGACAETAALLSRIARAIAEIRTPKLDQDLARVQR